MKIIKMNPIMWKFKLIFSILFLMCVCIGNACAMYDDSIIAKWTFDNDSATTVVDVTEHGNNGTSTNLNYVSSRYNLSGSFNGVDSAVTIPDSDSFSFLNGTTDTPFSISARINMTIYKAFRVITKTDVHTSGNEWFFGTSAGGLYAFQLYSGTSGTNILVTGANASYNTSEWVDFVGTYDGSGEVDGLKIYLNGELQPLTRTTGLSYAHTVNTNSPVYIGQIFPNDALKTNANGLIDDVTIYNKELTEDEVLLVSNSYMLYPNYIHQNENVNLAIYDTGSITVTTPNGSAYTIETQPGFGEVQFPDDFAGASTETYGNYSVRIRTINGNYVNTSFFVRETPITSFVVASDLHYDTAIWHDTVPSTQINAFVDDINNERFFHTPDAVFILGDNYYKVEHADEVKAILDNLSVNYYSITGNHEYSPNKAGEEPAGIRGKNYSEVFGNDYNYVVDLNGINIIMSGIGMDYPPFVGIYGLSLGDTANLAWLNSSINSSKTNIVMNHLVFDQPRTNGGAKDYWEGGAGGWAGPGHSAEYASSVRNVLESKNVQLQLGGHAHIISKTENNGVAYAICGTIQPSSYIYRYCDVYYDRIEVHTIRQDDDVLDYYIWTTSTDELHSTPETYHEGLDTEKEFTVELSDAVNFSTGTISGNAPLTVKFVGSGRSASSYSWDFENDSVIDSTKQNPVHTYGKAGTYTVNLTVQNEYGNFSTVKTDYIVVSAPA
ncbi:MAG: metallophosphoesterase, partial [Paludibacter sp.]|nr:metallophosphoesterase [Paludibacter sp.]